MKNFILKENFVLKMSEINSHLTSRALLAYLLQNFAETNLNHHKKNQLFKMETYFQASHNPDVRKISPN